MNSLGCSYTRHLCNYLVVGESISETIDKFSWIVRNSMYTSLQIARISVAEIHIPSDEVTVCNIYSEETIIRLLRKNRKLLIWEIIELSFDNDDNDTIRKGATRPLICSHYCSRNYELERRKARWPVSPYFYFLVLQAYLHDRPLPLQRLLFLSSFCH